MVIERVVERHGRKYLAYYFDGEERFRKLVKQRGKSPEEKAEAEALAADLVEQACALIDGYNDAPSDELVLDLFNLVGSYSAEAVHYWLKANSSRLLSDVLSDLRGRVDDLIMDCCTSVIRDKLVHYGRKTPLHGFIFRCVQNEMWNAQSRVAGHVVDATREDESESGTESGLDALISQVQRPESGLLHSFDGPSLKDLFFRPVGDHWHFLNDAIADFEATRTHGDTLRRLTLLQLGLVMNCPHVVCGLLLGRSGNYHAIANAGNPGSGAKPLDAQFRQFIGFRLLPRYADDSDFQTFKRHLMEQHERLGRILEDANAVGSAFLRLHAHEFGTPLHNTLG